MVFIWDNNMSMDTSSYKHTTAVNLSANGFVTKRGKNDGLTIGSDGLNDWTSNESIVSVYFYANKPFKFDLLIKCKVTSGESNVQITMDDKPEPIETVNVIGVQYQTIKVGSVEVTSIGYHRIDMKGVTRTGQTFADISQLMIAENTDEQNVKVLSSKHDRRVPQIQLWFVLPKMTPEFFYNEVTVPFGFDPIQTYFCAIGFQNGYCGIQVKCN